MRVETTYVIVHVLPFAVAAVLVLRAYMRGIRDEVR